MKRTAIILGVAAALAVPSVAAAGNNDALNKPQRASRVLVHHQPLVHRTQVHRAQVHRTQVASLQRVSAAITVQRMTPLRKVRRY